MTFTDLVRKGGSPDEIGAHLDGLSPSQRVEEVMALPGSLQAKLFDMFEGRPSKIDTLVPVAEETVIYELKNSLLLFNVGQKRFYRRPSGEVVGYNFQPSWLASTFSGPGYFFAQDADGDLEVDYTRLPTFRPDGWPEIKPNTGLIPGIVYGNQIDYMRQVSKHTAIGAAFQNGKPRNANFILTRAADQS